MNRRRAGCLAVGVIAALGGCARPNAQTERITVTIEDYDVGQDPELARQRELEQKIAELDAKLIKLEELGDAFERMMPAESAGEIYFPEVAGNGGGS